MNINELFRMQAALEQKISHLSGVEENALGENNILNVRILALQVKLGELANLTKCYKYQKDISSIPKNKILFRYIEGIKYLLSIGNKYQLNVINKDTLNSIQVSDDLIVLFSESYDQISKLKGLLEKDQYVNALNTYIKTFALYTEIGRQLDISYDEAITYFNDLSISA